ncbi:MAG: hypothetical protein LBG92_02720 [Prevotellaceae bacterium]|jgi:hypothetical protein|nr:hypothetical protein [Prevotellaceae bacterium]
MKRIFIGLILCIFSRAAFSQTADMRLASLINGKMWFKLKKELQKTDSAKVSGIITD